ncbi:MAG: metallophosphoesterase family protein, partial [Proteobacteria bacterium]
TTVSVGFNASTNSMTDSKVYYDVDDHGRDVQAYTFSKSIDVNRPYLDMNNAFAKLRKLKPDTLYYFVIQDGSGVSPTFSFKTLPDNPEVPLSIITGGDSRDNRTPRKNANLLVSKLRPHLVFFGGDMTSSGSAGQWKEWFEDWQATIGADGRMTAVIPARGNHESENSVLEYLFNTPPGVYYAVNLGGNLIRAYTLNSESSISGTQSDWLANDLQKNRNEIWRMAQYHRPMRPHVAGKEVASDLYDAWAELFSTYRMDLAIESDSHVVKSTWPIKKSKGANAKEGFERDDKAGTVFLGEGCWGAPLRTPNANKSWTRDSGSFNHFNWLRVDKEKMEIRTVKVDNAQTVGQVDPSDRFKAPAGLDIWSPANGAVITIKRNP